MTSNSLETVVPARVYVHLAPTGTAAPTTTVGALGVGWLNVGHTTPDSLSFNTEPEFAQVDSHQSDYPIRRIQTSESAAVSVNLLQWNAANFKAAYGGGTVTETVPSSGIFKFVPPSLGGRSETSAIVELIDGTKIYRWVYPRTMQIEGVQNEFQKGQSSTLPLRLAVLGDDGVVPWYLITNDPAFDPA